MEQESIEKIQQSLSKYDKKSQTYQCTGIKCWGFFVLKAIFFYLPINFEHDDMNDKDVYYYLAI